MKKLLSICLAVAIALTLFTGCGEQKPKELVMGFVPHRDGDKLIEDVAPLEEMLSKEMGIKVKAFTATSYVAVVEGFGSGAVDFGLIPPFASVHASEEFKAKPILVVVKKNGSTTYKSQLLVRKDSGIKTLEDIKGKKVAFVEAGSTSGYLFPAALLKEKGIDLEKDIQYLYAGGHDKALQLLLNGDVDVAATFADARTRYAKEFPDAVDVTEVLEYTQDIPGVSITVSSKMDEETVKKLKE
ncbi:MAG: phosphate/phosphite/phosphonate ABC transporter substrate-binding protein, partial [Bacillota bacterium]|nr:phosphate/phosphite/phosphonate ABC transporter substrate-binding protein [Bacillota bacterium]